MAGAPLVEIDSVFTFKLTVKSCGGVCFTNAGLCGTTWRTFGVFVFVEMSFGITFSAIFGGEGVSIAAVKIDMSSTGRSEGKALVAGTALALIMLVAGFKLGLEHALLLLLLELVRMLVLEEE